MTFGSWTYDNKGIDYRHFSGKDSAIGFHHMIENEEWRMLGSKGCTFFFIAVNIRRQRIPYRLKFIVMSNKKVRVIKFNNTKNFSILVRKFFNDGIKFIGRIFFKKFDFKMQIINLLKLKMNMQILLGKEKTYKNFNGNRKKKEFRNYFSF